MKWLIPVVIGFSLLTFSKWILPSTGKKYAPYFSAAEKKYNLPSNLLGRMAQQESAFNPTARSHAGAVGLMQIIPRYHPSVDPTDPIASIDYAGHFIRQLYNDFQSWKMALAAYNWGPSNVRQFLAGSKKMPLETKNYIDNIAGDLMLWN